MIVVLRFTAGSRIREVRKFADRMVAMSPSYIQKHLKSGTFDEYVTPEAGEVLDRCAVMHNVYFQAIFSGSALPDRFVEPDDIKPLSQAMRALMEAGLSRLQPALMFKTPLQPADIEALREVERNMRLIRDEAREMRKDVKAPTALPPEVEDVLQRIKARTEFEETTERLSH